MLKNPEEIYEDEGKEAIELLMEKLEVLVTDLQYNVKQIEKLQKDVQTFDVRITETTNIINILKRDLKRKSHPLSYQSFKVCDI